MDGKNDWFEANGFRGEISDLALINTLEAIN